MPFLDYSSALKRQSNYNNVTLDRHSTEKKGENYLTEKEEKVAEMQKYAAIL